MCADTFWPEDPIELPEKPSKFEIPGKIYLKFVKSFKSRQITEENYEF